MKRVVWQSQSVPNFIVMVANGERLKVQELCLSLVLTVQWEKIISDFYIFPLRGCDMVFGV